MSYKLHYFAGYGRADSIRMLLKHAKVDFEEVNYTFETIADAKAAGILEFGQLPVLEHNGKHYSQSNAILRALGKIHGYYPEEAYEAWRVDSTLELIGDLQNAFYRAAFAPSEDLKKTLMADFFGKHLPNFTEAV